MTRKARSLRLWWIVLGALVALGLAVVIAMTLALGGAGRATVLGQFDGRVVPGLGRIAVEGGAGALGRDPRIGRIAFADGERVWLVIEDVALDWRAGALLARRLDVRALSARRVEVLGPPPAQPPDRSPDPPSPPTWPRGWTLDLAAMSIETMIVHPEAVPSAPFAGAPAEFAFEGSARARAIDDAGLVLALTRTDGAADALDLRLDLAPGAGLTATGTLTAPAGGALAALAPFAPGGAVIRLDGGGDAAAGRARLEIDQAAAPAGRLDLSWDADGVAATGEVRTQALAPLAAFAGRIGPDISLTLNAPPIGAAGEARVRLAAEGGAVDARAEVDWRRPAAPDGFILRLEAPRPSDWVETSAVELGPLTVEGVFTTAETRFDGAIALDGAASRSGALAGVSAARIAGPLTLARDDAGGRLTLTAELSVTGLAASQEVGPAARSLLAITGSSIEIAAEAAFDPLAETLAVRRLDIAGAGLDLAARGDWNLADGALTAVADLRLLGLAGVHPMLTGGTLAGQASVEGALDGGPLRLDIDVAARDLAVAAGPETPPELIGLIGTAPRLVAEASLAAGALDVARADLTLGAGAAALSGRVDLDAGAFDLDGGLRLAPDLAIGPVVLGGAPEAAFALTGDLARPRLHIEATAPQIDAFGADLTQVRARAEAVGLPDAFSLALRVDGAGPAGPFDLSSEISGAITETIDGAGPSLALTALSGVVGPWTIEGAGRYDADGPSGRLAAVAPDLGLSVTAEAAAGTGLLVATLEAGPRPLPGGLSLAGGVARASGPISTLGSDLELTAEARFEGAAPGELRLAGRIDTIAGQGAEEGATRRFTGGLSGNLGDVPITTPTPWRLDLGPAGITGGITGSLALEIDGGRLTLDSIDGAESTGGGDWRLALVDAPISAIRAVRPGADLVGRLDGSGVLTLGPEPTGALDLTVSGLASSRDADAPSLDGQLALKLEVGAVTLDADARGSGGLEGRISAQIDRPDAGGPPGSALTGLARVSGPIDTLWTLLGPLDTRARGRLDLDLTLGGSAEAPRIAGRAGFTDGTFEDFASGLRLARIGVEAAFDGDGGRIDRFEAAGPDGGRLSATGSAAFAADGPSVRLDIALDRLRALDREEVRAVLSGPLAVALKGNAVRVSGDLVIDALDAEPLAARPPAGVVVIDVVEVGRPADLDPPPAPAPRFDTVLDLGVRADRRLFVRAPGLQTEWGLDVRVLSEGGPVRLRGRADLLGGDLDLGGARFVFEPGEVRLDGDPAAAALDLQARWSGVDLDAAVQITGRSGAPEVQLTSTPSLPEDEILARVLFGRSAADLGPLEAAQLAGALAQLAGGGFDLTGALRQGLGVDRLRFGRDAGGSATFAGGKYVADGVYLEIASGGRDGPKATIEWTLRPRVQLVSELSQTRDAAIALRWRRDY